MQVTTAILGSGRPPSARVVGLQQIVYSPLGLVDKAHHCLLFEHSLETRGGHL